MFKWLKDFWDELSFPDKVVLPQKHVIKYVCTIRVRWTSSRGGDSNPYDEDITVSVYSNGTYEVYQYGYCKTFNMFKKYKPMFEHYKQTGDVRFIEKYITWRAQ